jgi:hypothetical protein
MHTVTCNAMNCRGGGGGEQRVERGTSIWIRRIFPTACFYIHLQYVKIYQTTRSHTALSQEISPRNAVNIHHV